MKNFKMKKLFQSRSSKVVLGSALVLSSVGASAAIDVTPAVTVLTTDGTAVITAIGLAMLGLAALAVVFKWAKASIFG